MTRRERILAEDAWFFTSKSGGKGGFLGGARNKITAKRSYILSALSGTWDRILLLFLCEAVGEMRLRKSVYDHCIEQSDATLLKQWHPAKNGTLTPP